MGSVIDYGSCEKCGGFSYSDFNYRSMEEYNSCSRCGYHYSRELKYDDKGNLVKDKDGNYEYEVEEIESGIVYGFLTKSGSGSTGVVPRPLDPAFVEDFKRQVEEHPEVSEETSYIVDYQDGKVNIIYGNPPERVLLSAKEYDAFLNKENESSMALDEKRVEGEIDLSDDELGSIFDSQEDSDTEEMLVEDAEEIFEEVAEEIIEDILEEVIDEEEDTCTE